MNSQSLPLWLALFMQLGLGLAVFRANPRNYANQSFLLVSAIICGWLLSLHFAYNSVRAEEAELWIRNASSIGLLIVNGFDLLRLAIVYRETGWREIGKRSLLLLIPSLLVIGLMVAIVVVAVVSRRQRRGAGSLGPTLHRPVRLHAENGTQPQHQQARPDQDLLIAHKAEREQ